MKFEPWHTSSDARYRYLLHKTKLGPYESVLRGGCGREHEGAAGGAVVEGDFPGLQTGNLAGGNIRYVAN